ncbi:MAG: peptidoglycan DD-metalloendopeptidase family protein [Bacteroidia bacterium]|nr:peptidoglycan DD-metalloendopeptidase family protein [Bacteroidia bacterium]
MSERNPPGPNGLPPRRKPKVVVIERSENTSTPVSLPEKEKPAPEPKPRIVSPPVSQRKRAPKVIIIERDEPQEELMPEKQVPEPVVIPERRAPKVKSRTGTQLKPEKETPAEETENSEIKEEIQPKKSKKWLWITILLVLIGVSVGLAFQYDLIPALPGEQNMPKENCLGIQPELNWGYALGDLECTRGVVSPDQTLDDILLARKVNWKMIADLNRLVFTEDAPKLATGNKYTLLFPKADPLHPQLFAYEPDSARVILMNLSGKPEVKIWPRKVISHSIRTKTVLIQQDLADVMFNQEFGLKLTESMERVLRWKVDFFHLGPGDYFTISYEEQKLEGGITTLGRIRAIHFHAQDKDINAFYFKRGELEGYYDEQARPLASSFLLAPVQYGRISSYYNLRRNDPINRGEIRAHLGTDYAAPLGTPIIAVADGIVEAAENKGGNGNYVKLIHSEEIKTQYLHMQSFAEGIVPGKQVSQGDVIGYVGSTGRSTGPHVCFRYWKNGEQVNHLKEEFPSPAPIQGNLINYFFETRDSMRAHLDGIN